MNNQKIEDIITFGELEKWDIFETESGDYYLKTEPSNGFNTILLTGDYIKLLCFENDTKVWKFK